MDILTVIKLIIAVSVLAMIVFYLRKKDRHKNSDVHKQDWVIDFTAGRFHKKEERDIW